MYEENFMPKNRWSVIALTLALAVAVSGCVDLFAVPGVGISPDGTQLYFLSPLDPSAGATSDSFQLSMVSASGGEVTNIMESFGAFAISPANGQVVFSGGLQDGETDQTFLMRYDGNSAGLFIGPEAFGDRNFIATQMVFSPDGSKIAMTGLTLPLGTDLDSINEESLSPEDLALFDSVLYIADVNSGELTLVTDPAAQWANTVTWSPNGQLVAYNAWLDSNGDGTINTAGSFMSMAGGEFGAVSDNSLIHIYDVGSGSTTVVESSTTSYSPAFVDDGRLAYATADATMMMVGSGGGISVYDIGAGSSSPVFTPADGGFILGIATSPDGSRVAWTQLGGGTDPSGNQPNELWISDSAFSNPSMLASLGAELGFYDGPVWMPDSSGVLVAATNLFASVMGSMMSGFAGMGDAFGAGDLGGDEFSEAVAEIPQQDVRLVNADTGEVTVLYSGPIFNGNLIASVISLVGLGDLEGAMGGLGGFDG
jgi:hypothetical protein